MYAIRSYYVVDTGLCASKGEARRLIKQGGVKINDQTLADPEAKLAAGQVADGQIKLSAGKKRHALVKVA